jgi:hypothetical protein
MIQALPLAGLFFAANDASRRVDTLLAAQE